MALEDDFRAFFLTWWVTTKNGARYSVSVPVPSMVGVTGDRVWMKTIVVSMSPLINTDSPSKRRPSTRSRVRIVVTLGFGIIWGI